MLKADSAPDTDSTEAPPDTVPALPEDRRIDYGDAATYVLGRITQAGVPVALSFITVLTIDDLKQPWVNSFTDNHGAFQVICPRPGRYKIIVAKTGAGGGVRFSSVNITVAPEKKGYFYHLGDLDLVTANNRANSASPFTDTIAEKAALLERKNTQAAILGQSFFVSGKLVDQATEALGFTSISIEALADSVPQPMTTFTHSDGSFQAVCSTPGRYRIWLSKMANGPEAFFDLSAKTAGILDIGVKKLEKPVEMTGPKSR